MMERQRGALIFRTADN